MLNFSGLFEVVKEGRILKKIKQLFPKFRCFLFRTSSKSDWQAS